MSLAISNSYFPSELPKKAKTPDELTPLVIEYQENPNPELFKKLYQSKQLKRLLWQVIKNYGVMGFPIIIQEDIAEDCQSIVLLRTLGKYDRTRGAAFGTLFTWWCMSHVRNKRNQWLRREPLLNAYSLSGRVYNGSDRLEWLDKLSNFNANAKHRLSRSVANNKELVFEVT